LKRDLAQLREDRALRDAARGVLLADIDHAKSSLSGPALAGRVARPIGDGVKDVFEVAKTHADDNRGLFAGLIALLALWFARAPLLEILGLAQGDEEPVEEGQDTSKGPGTDPDTGPVETDIEQPIPGENDD